MTYSELKSQHAPCVDVFFAFSLEQLASGKAGIGADKKIYYAGSGLYGTDEGIKNFLGFYEKINAQIAESCNPQDVYNYEFINHECEYIWDDSEAFDIVVGLFGADKAASVIRRCAG